MDGLKIERNERKQIFLVCNFFFPSLSTPKIAHVNFPADVLVTLCFSVSYEQHKSRVMEAIYICRQRKAAAVLAVQLKEHWASFFFFFVSRVAFWCKKKRWTETWRAECFYHDTKAGAIVGDFRKNDWLCSLWNPNNIFTVNVNNLRQMEAEKKRCSTALCKQTCHHMYLQGKTSESKFILTCLLSSH